MQKCCRPASAGHAAEGLAPRRPPPSGREEKARAVLGDSPAAAAWGSLPAPLFSA